MVILVLSTSALGGWGEEMGGKMILEVLEAEITYYNKRIGVENPLNKQCEIT